MLPFQIQFKAGESVYGQVVYAAKKAVVSGLLQPGDRFPSVRQLSQEFKINPNTAHKAIASLIEDGLLEVHPGVGTVVAKTAAPNRADRRDLLTTEMEKLVVEALKLSLDLPDVTAALAQTWERITNRKS